MLTRKIKFFWLSKATPYLYKATPYNKRKQNFFDGDRDLREQFSFLPLLITHDDKEILCFFILFVRISVVPRSVNDRSILLDGVNYVTVGISIQ